MRGVIITLMLAFGSAALAQEGFPLDGTWRGETTAPDGSHRTIVLIMEWDGEQISGTINPGPKGVDFTTGKLNPEGWKFTLDAAPATSAPIHFIGTLSSLGKYDRVLAGKWTEGGSTIEVRFVRE
jgi:hypothetical protein